MKVFTILACMAAAAGAWASEPIEYGAEVRAGLSTGDFAPYYISALQGGRNVESNSATLTLEAHRSLDLSERLSWSYGVEVDGGYNHHPRYDRWDADAAQWTTHTAGPAPIHLQQLYGQLKYRGVVLTAGMKAEGSPILDDRITSGDLTRSGNARPVPMVQLGFVDFQNIPFTNGWVQIEGVIGYGKFTDNGWLRDQYNYYNNHINTGELYTYKRCYFRTNPTQPVSVTVGAQCAGIFGGTATWYRHGEVVQTHRFKGGFKEMIKMFLPLESATEDGDWIIGNTLGSWDFKLRWTIDPVHSVDAYFEWPWEDGSGLRKGNGFDGLWGVAYHSSRPAIVSSAAIEYLDFTNQSGPLHYATGDNPWSDISHGVTGADDYYNNYSSRPYANYGSSMGTPFLLAPVYNLDGYPGYLYNRTRGFHAAVNGYIGSGLDYTFKIGAQRAWGNGRIPVAHPRDNFSLLAAVGYDLPSRLPLHATLALAMDRGSLRGNNFGVLLGITYHGSLTLGHK